MPIPPVEHDQLFRFESLGDNCELGFALRRLGCDFGGVFKWARSEPEQVAAVLRADFAGPYRFDALSPHRDAMVLDAANGIGWHTKMFSQGLADGTRAFVQDTVARHAVWQEETQKMRRLEARLRQRLRLGHSIFVIKSNAGIAPEALDAVCSALAALAQGVPFSLLEVCPAAGEAVGTVALLGPGRMRGFVSRFASYNNAAAIDLDAWGAVLRGAAQLQPCADWKRRSAELQSGAANGEITLLFPERPEPDLTAPLYADLRGGWPQLEHGNAWCRKVEDGFRLHAPSRGERPAVLSWNAVRLPGACRLVASAKCAVEDSLPVVLRLQVGASGGAVIAEQAVTVDPDQEEGFAVDVAAPPGRPLRVTLSANASALVASGQRAVVDLSAVQILVAPRP